MKIHEFDNYADNYESLHNENIAITGESSDYFVQYKCDHFLRLFPNIPFEEGKCILDYGCGIGRLAVKLADACPKSSVVGMDPSSESIKRAALRTRPNLRFIHSDGSMASLRENTVDFIISANVLHHIVPEDRGLFLLGLNRFLRENGKLIIYEHNPLNPLTRMAVSQCVFDKNAVLLDLFNARELVSSADMNIVRCGYIVFFPNFLRALRVCEPFLSFLPLGAQYFIVGQKIGLS